MGEEGVLEDVVTERNILYDRLVPVEWPETTTVLVNAVSAHFYNIFAWSKNKIFEGFIL